MLRIPTLVALIIFSALWAGIRPSTAWACSCIPPGPPAEALADATAVFSGGVLQIDTPAGLLTSSADPVRVTFRVNTVWKGPQHTTLTVTTARDSASCGYGFKEGENYLVYAGGFEDDLQVNLCSRTQLLSGAQKDLVALGEGYPVDSQTDAASDPAGDGLAPVAWFLITSAGLALVIVGARIVARSS